ncbi:MAG: hypothetical protein BGN89_19375 [Alphaproteobacteria bacterium 64-6]|nr:MAG: hypothetical protein BGN89_19375 [Alphaproteobacteria bacterium 64-6]
MSRRFMMAVGLGFLLAPAASAAPLEDTLAKMSPEFRAHQVCILRGLTAVRQEPALRKADRMKTSIFRPAVVEGTKLTASGGAVRAAGHWYALSFTCDLSGDWKKATSFSFVLGREIPQGDWERLGLWR